MRQNATNNGEALKGGKRMSEIWEILIDFSILRPYLYCPMCKISWLKDNTIRCECDEE
jgi:hypothetical protein